MKYFTFFLCLFLLSCSGDSEDSFIEPEDSEFDWIIEKSDLFGNFAPFPLATNINYQTASSINFIPSTQKVAVVKIDHVVKIYPSHFINIFEVVNDQIGNFKYAVTYCPITESIVGFNSVHKDNVFTLIASGYLYKNNQVLYDKATNSYWSQMELRSIKGQFQHETLETFPIIETNWETAKEAYPNSQVFIDATKTIKPTYSKSINKDPEHNTPFYGVVNFDVKELELHLFGFDLFENGIGIQKRTIDGTELIVVGSKELKFITSFINYENIDFKPLQGNFPNILTDSEGNTWDVFGKVTSGIKKGEQLSSPIGFFASWWAWDSFYKTIVIH